jgi:dihydrofolate reductase
MRTLKLQMQISVDGYVAGPNGELDWMTFRLDDKLGQCIDALADSADTILLGRKMTDGFVAYWEGVIHNQPNSPEFAFAKKMVETPKVVFSRTLETSRWANTTLATGNLADEIADFARSHSSHETPPTCAASPVSSVGDLPYVARRR